jgi:hypothetical protein
MTGAVDGSSNNAFQQPLPSGETSRRSSSQFHSGWQKCLANLLVKKGRWLPETADVQSLPLVLCFKSAR